MCDIQKEKAYTHVVGGPHSKSV